MFLKRIFIFFLLPFMLQACDDNGGTYTQVKGIEDLLYRAILAYREDNGFPVDQYPFVHQYIMVAEAQSYSYRMALGQVELGTQDLERHWETIHEKLGGYNDQALVLSTTFLDEDEILDELLLQAGADSMLLEDVTQCGVGIETDGNGNNFVTVLLMKID
jgi:hypothetical protein